MGYELKVKDLIKLAELSCRDVQNGLKSIVVDDADPTFARTKSFELNKLKEHAKNVADVVESVVELVNKHKVSTKGQPEKEDLEKELNSWKDK